MDIFYFKSYNVLSGVQLLYFINTLNLSLSLSGWFCNYPVNRKQGVKKSAKPCRPIRSRIKIFLAHVNLHKSNRMLLQSEKKLLYTQLLGYILSPKSDTPSGTHKAEFHGCKWTFMEILQSNFSTFMLALTTPPTSPPPPRHIFSSVDWIHWKIGNSLRCCANSITTFGNTNFSPAYLPVFRFKYFFRVRGSVKS